MRDRPEQCPRVTEDILVRERTREDAMHMVLQIRRVTASFQQVVVEVPDALIALIS